MRASDNVTVAFADQAIVPIRFGVGTNHEKIIHGVQSSPNKASSGLDSWVNAFKGFDVSGMYQAEEQIAEELAEQKATAGIKADPPLTWEPTAWKSTDRAYKIAHWRTGLYQSFRALDNGCYEEIGSKRPSFAGAERDCAAHRQEVDRDAEYH